MRTRLAITIALTALLALMLTVPLPESRRELTALGDLAHGPAFAVFAVLVLRVFPRRLLRSDVQTVLTVWTLVVGFGCLTEALQGLVGRNPSWRDVLANALGAGAGLLWAETGTTASRGLRAGILAACGFMLAVAVLGPSLVLTDACLQRIEMPQVASFERPLELSRWTARECRIGRVRGHATHGSWALRMDLQPGLYPGAALSCPLPDWSRYEELVLDLELNIGPPLDLIVKITDAQHNGEYHDRFHRTVRLQGGKQQVCIALSEVAAAPRSREMDLRQISLLQLFTARLDSPRTLYLDNVRLR